MRFRRGATLDTGQVTDARGRGGAGGLALGGGGLGIIGLVAYLLISLLSGGGGLGQLGPLDNASVGRGDTPSSISQDCKSGADANQRDDCRIVGVVNSVQKFWNGVFTASKREVPVRRHGLLHGLDPDRVRLRVVRRRPVLLPGRPPRVHRPRVLRRRQVTARRRSDAVRRGVRARARVRPPRPGPARRPRRDPRRYAGRRRARAFAPSSRRTATRGCGRITRSRPG